MTGLGLAGSGSHSGEVRLSFRHGLVRSVSVVIGGAGLIGLAIAVVDLAQKEPARFFDLLSRWGFIWIVALAGMAFVWDIARRYLGRLADSVQELAVASNRYLDRDDRERDRMQTEIAFIGRRMEKLSNEHEKTRDEMRDNHREVVALISQALSAKGHGDGNA